MLADAGRGRVQLVSERIFKSVGSIERAHATQQLRAVNTASGMQNASSSCCLKVKDESIDACSSFFTVN
jgi:hypothetical protein